MVARRLPMGHPYPAAAGGNAIARAIPGYGPSMLTKALRSAGVRGSHAHAVSIGSVGLCITLWIRAKTVGQDERGNAERRALFVGLWPPMFWLIGDTLERHERRRTRLPWNS